MRINLSQGAIYLAFFSTPCLGANLVVTVANVQDNVGIVGCVLFSTALAPDFPLETSKAIKQRTPAQSGRMRCEFNDVPPGTYALAVSHDRNGNGKLDRNVVGRPTEPWAVSNNVRHTLRPARFAEGAFTLSRDEMKLIELRLGR